MSLAVVHSRALHGLHAPPVRVEAHLANGLPLFTIVGLPEASVRESRERVRAAILNSGLEFPNRRITVNLAPADLPKESGRFDLPIAIGVLAASGQVPAAVLRHYEFAGELSLTGHLQPIRAALALACSAAADPDADAAAQTQADGGAGAGTGAGTTAVPDAATDTMAATGSAPMTGPNASTARAPRTLVLPGPNLAEAAHSDHPQLLGVRTLSDLVRHLHDPLGCPLQAPSACSAAPPAGPRGRDRGTLRHGHAPDLHDDDDDLADVAGQLQARRALEIAAAGHHALLMVGPPGTGKSMLARRLPGILPPWPRAQALQSAAIASLTGRLNAASMQRRPFRAPHHSVSTTGLIGGGLPPRPGEISLAHHGTLFLDELPEFRRTTLEALREPLETGEVVITRGTRSESFPASFLLVAAMNPCPCGHAGDPRGACVCSGEAIRRYRARLSGPLLDRFDLCIDVPHEPPAQQLHAAAAATTGDRRETSADVAGRVAAARQRAQQRQGCPNGRLPAHALHDGLRATDDALDWARQAAVRRRWSMRAFHRVLKVARTIADLDGAEWLRREDVAEATAHRSPLLDAADAQPSHTATAASHRY